VINRGEAVIRKEKVNGWHYQDNAQHMKAKIIPCEGCRSNAVMQKPFLKGGNNDGGIFD
jgi:hypothetical protein